MRFGKKRGRAGKRGNRPVEVQIPVAAPAIISREVWEQAQRQRESNRKKSMRHAKRLYILRGRIECSCGHSMSGQSRGHGYWSYRRCKTMGKYYPGLEQCNCCQKQLDGRKLETAAWEFTMDALTNREFFEQALLDAQAKQAKQAQPQRERLDLVLTLMGECEQNAAKLAAAIAGQVNKNGIVGQALQRQADDLDAQYRKLTNERDRLIAELAADNLTREDIDRDLRLRDDVMLGLQNPTPEIMMQAFEVIDLRVTVVEGDRVKLTCRQPVDSRVIDINTPGGIQARYPRFITLARQIDLSAILFERAVQIMMA